MDSGRVSMSQEWSRVVSLKGLLKSIYEKSSDLSGTIVYSKYPGMLSPSQNLVLVVQIMVINNP